MNRNEQEYYANINGIAKALDRIANALENQNQFVVNTIKGQKAQDKVVDKAVDRILDNGIDFTPHQIDKDEQLDIQHDYLHQLVQNLDNNGYHEFCNEHCLPANDAVAVSNYITDLDYDEVLGIISDLEASNDLSIRYKNKIKEFPKSDDQANEDAIEEVDFRENHIICPDLDLRETAKMYTNELTAGNFNTKKECILDYVTNEFGSHGARYTDIIKFAYYLGQPNAARYSNRDRGYYSCAISGRNAHLIRGGKDFLVKGINKEGDERYFAHSFVESVTDYWKYI